MSFKIHPQRCQQMSKTTNHRVEWIPAIVSKRERGTSRHYARTLVVAMRVGKQPDANIF